MSEDKAPYNVKPIITDGDMDKLDDSRFLEALLRSLTTQVDLVERRLGRTPRTAEIRQWWRKTRH